MKKYNIGNNINPTEVTDYDIHISPKDKFGVSYSSDGTRLIGIKEKKDFCSTEYHIIDGTKIICDEAFSGCSHISKIIIPDSVEIIGSWAFANCRSLENIVFSNSLKTIKSFAFKDCKKLNNIVLPNTLESLGEMVFSYTNIKEIVLPYSLKEIEGNPITYNNVCFKSNSPHFIVEDNNLYNKGKKTILSFQSEKDSFIIPETVETIGNYAFWYTKLNSITITPNVSRIGINPFANIMGIDFKFTNLSPHFHFENGLLITNDKKTLISCLSNTPIVILPLSITTIAENAFCSKYITNCILHNKLKRINNWAFEGCKELTNINLPNSIEYIGRAAFYRCSSLVSINIPPKIKCISRSLFYKCTSIRNIEIPLGVTKIDKYAFCHCHSLIDIIIPSSVAIIEKSAFYGCRWLKSVFIPKSVKRIGYYAFSDCQEVTIIRRGRSSYKQYSSMSLIATDIGNKERIQKMLPKYLHSIIKEQSLEHYIHEQDTIEENTEIEEIYNNEGFERVKCPRCGDWYYVYSGVCDTCGYPWNE